MVNAREELLRQVPEVEEQRRRFERVFGEEVTERIRREEEAFAGRRRVAPAPPPTAEQIRNQTRANKVITAFKLVLGKDINQVSNDLRNSFVRSLRTIKDRNERLKLKEDLRNDLANLKSSSTEFFNKVKNQAVEVVANKDVQTLRQEFIGFNPDFARFIGATREVITRFETRPEQIQKRQEQEERRLQAEQKSVEKQNERILRDFEKERKQIIDLDSGVTRLETKEEFIKRKIPKGFSITQKFFEAFGADFYKKGERQAIINQVLNPLQNVNSSEAQQVEIDKLKAKGINVTTIEQNGEIFFEVDTGTLAPTSQFGNILVSLTDFIFKAGFFGAFLKTGVAKKGKARTKQKAEQKVVSKTKETSKAFEKLDAFIEKTFKTQGREGVNNFLTQANSRLTTSTQRENFLKFLEGLKNRDLIRGFAYDKNTGQLVLFSDKLTLTQIQQTTQALVKQTPTIQINIETFGIPRLEKAPEIVAAIGGLVSSAQNSKIQKIRAIQKQLDNNKKQQARATTNMEKSLLKNQESSLQNQLKIQEEGLRLLQQSQQARFPSQVGARFQPLGVAQGRFQISPTLQSARTNQRQKILSTQRQIANLKNQQRLATTPLQKNLLKSKQKFLQRQLNQQRLRFKQLQKLALKLRTTQLQKQRFRQKQIQKQILRARQARARKPKLKILKPFGFIVGIKKKKKKVVKKRIRRGAFNVFVRKKGKDTFLKSFSTPKKARKGLKKNLAVTLRASGFVSDRAGKKLTPKISKGFRLSKVRPNVLVEKRNRRLDSRTEVKSIQIAKRLAPKKKPFNSKDGSTMSKKLRRKKK